MASQGLRFWIILALQLRCAVLFSIPYDNRFREPVKRDDPLDVNWTVKKKLDELFNLKDLPQSSTTPSQKKAPQFMLDMFNAVADTNGIPKNQKEILEGNIVRSFEDKGHAGGRFHFFNLSSMSKEEQMIKAEFRWFRHKQKIFHGSKSYGLNFYKVDIYEVLDNRVKPWRGNLITSRLVPLYTQGWEVFNITQMVSKWMRKSEENNGILVVTTLSSGHWLEVSNQRVGQAENRNAYLVIFSNDGRAGTATNRTVNRGHINDAGLPEAQEQQDQRSRRRRAAPSFFRGRPEACQLTPLFVDFEEIGWAGWIISPRGYNAYHCKGSCPFPLGESLRATNHATVQSIMHALKISNDISMPCCVPDKLQSISMLYFDDEENVVLKQYDDMVAVSCGCH